MFQNLEKINSRPEPFHAYTAETLWNDEHTSKNMLAYHLDENLDVSSRNRDFIERSVRWIVSRFNVGPNTAVADFGCGPGLYAMRLADEKADVTGIDFSERSIRYARKTAARKGLRIDYVLQNYLEFETEKRFDLILMIMCDFCALGPADRSGLLGKFRRFLKRGGRFLFDVYSLNAFDGKKENAVFEYRLLNGFWSPGPYYGFLNTFKYNDEKVTLDKYTIVEKERTRTVYNWLQYFSPGSLEKELRKNGFEIEECFSDVAGKAFDPKFPEFAVIAGKL